MYTEIHEEFNKTEIAHTEQEIHAMMQTSIFHVAR